MSIRSIGEPIEAVHIWTAAYGQEQGRDRIYAVSSGKPCVLFVVDPHTGQCLERHLLEGASHSWGAVATASGVYVGGDGNLYRYTPGQGVSNLGNAIPGEHYTWRVAADNEGNVYGGCYPGGKVYQYNPANGAFRDYGQIVAGEQYTRCMMAHGDKLYIGVGTKKPHLIELHIETGEAREIPLPAPWQREQLVYDLDISYPYLFIRVTPSNVLLVYNMQTEEWTDSIAGVMGLSVSPAGDDGRVYFGKDGQLYAYHPAKKELSVTALMLSEAVSDMAWLDWQGEEFSGKSLMNVNRNGSYWVYHPPTDRYITKQPELRGRPIQIQSMALGPDGRINVGGYFAGGFASYDPAAGNWEAYKGIGQIENMIAFGGQMYLGVYTHANIFRYDPQKPWQPGDNPQLLFSLSGEEQDRPFAFVAAGEELAIGTVPTYGRLGGALSLYHPEKERLEVYRNIVEDQSIVSLAFHNGMIYGGSSIWGGLGVAPKRTEACLVIWDTNSRSKVWEGVPVPGEKAISALAVDRDGFLWGLTAGTLFQFAPDSKQVVQTIELFPHDWSEVPHYWRGGYLRYDDNHYFVGSTLGKLFRYDLATHKLDILDDNALFLVRDGDGNYYFARETEVYKYEWPQ